MDFLTVSHRACSISQGESCFSRSSSMFPSCDARGHVFFMARQSLLCTNCCEKFARTHQQVVVVHTLCILAPRSRSYTRVCAHQQRPYILYLVGRPLARVQRSQLEYRRNIRCDKARFESPPNNINRPPWTGENEFEQDASFSTRRYYGTRFYYILRDFHHKDESRRFPCTAVHAATFRVTI